MAESRPAPAPRPRPSPAPRPGLSQAEINKRIQAAHEQYKKVHGVPMPPELTSFLRDLLTSLLKAAPIVQNAIKGVDENATHGADEK